MSVTPERAPLQPAEWSPHRACLTAWPASEEAWGDALAAAQAEFATFIDVFCAHAGEPLMLLVPRGSRPDAVAFAGAALRCLPIPYGDVWLRDIAPVWLSNGTAVRFEFNGWGDKYHYPNDAEAAESIASFLDAPCRPVPLVAEGGALESDGEGTYLTTRACLLNRNRNPDLGEADVEAVLAAHMGARRVIWLDEGLAGDHTDGHIDNLARFVAPATVVCTAAQRDDPNHAVLTEIEARLRDSRDASDRPLRVLPLPSPGVVRDARGEPMPASYMNFYVANRAVFVPAYGGPADAEACKALQALFPGRRVLGVPSRAILTGGGSLHCVTQQVPA